MKPEENQDFSFANCGFLYKTRVFLGASPHRIVHDPTEETPGVAEFKFIQVKDEESILDVLLKQHIRIKTQKGTPCSRLCRKVLTHISELLDPNPSCFTILWKFVKFYCLSIDDFATITVAKWDTAINYLHY